MKRTMLFALLALVAIANASTGKKASLDAQPNMPYVHAQYSEVNLHNGAIYTEEEFKNDLKDAEKRGKRSTASDISEASLHPEFVTYRNRFLELTDTKGLPNDDCTEKLDQILFELESDKYYSQFKSNTMKFFAAQLAPIRAYRGFFNRVRGFAKDYPFIQSYLVTIAKQMASNTEIFLTYNDPTTQKKYDHMKVLFRYISEPYTYDANKEYSKIRQKDKYWGIRSFTKESDIQNWFLADVIPRVQQSTDRLIRLVAKEGGQKSNFEKIIWDNRIIAGSDSYQDGNDRFRVIGLAEVNAVISNFYGNIANMYIFSSYGVDGLFRLTRELGYLYGIEQMETRIKGDWVLKGSSAQERTDKIIAFVKSNSVRTNGAKLFTLIENENSGSFIDSGKARMRKAYQASLLSNDYARISWTEIKNRNDDDSNALDRALFRPFTKVIDSKIINTVSGVFRGNLSEDQLIKARKGELVLNDAQIKEQFYPIKSGITNESIEANVVRFFFDPPKDLTEFLPKSFVGDRNTANMIQVSKVLDQNQKAVTYRNYFYGSANGWNPAAFKNYFKVGTQGGSVNTNEDVKTLLRVTTQSWGGLIVGMSLVNIML